MVSSLRGLLGLHYIAQHWGIQSGNPEVVALFQGEGFSDLGMPFDLTVCQRGGVSKDVAIRDNETNSLGVSG